VSVEAQTRTNEAKITVPQWTLTKKNCSETALKLLWNSSETALKLLWNCSKIALKKVRKRVVSVEAQKRTNEAKITVH